ncbi:MAG TPA: hypothetical protein VK464_11295 [Symbiobacteriaceae bacterium]|nr:hypothetical protein [Symbiobacteriaceae bacterium]
MPWLPGGPVKVNWVEHGGGGGQLALELRRPGASTPSYRLEQELGPGLRFTALAHLRGTLIPL